MERRNFMSAALPTFALAFQPFSNLMPFKSNSAVEAGKFESGEKWAVTSFDVTSVSSKRQSLQGSEVKSRSKPSEVVKNVDAKVSDATILDMASSEGNGQTKHLERGYSYDVTVLVGVPSDVTAEFSLQDVDGVASKPLFVLEYDSETVNKDAIEKAPNDNKGSTNAEVNTYTIKMTVEMESKLGDYRVALSAVADKMKPQEEKPPVKNKKIQKTNRRQKRVKADEREGKRKKQQPTRKTKKRNKKDDGLVLK